MRAMHRPSPTAILTTVAALLLTGSLLACGTSSEAHDVKEDAATMDAGVADGASDAASSDASDASDVAVGDGAPTLITEPTQGMTPVYDFIGSAKKSLDMTMYELTDTTVTGMLASAAAKGVTVRVILDQKLEGQANTAAYNALNAAKVQVHWANPTYAATHQKTITVDGKTSAVMSLNLDPEYYATTRDFAVITSDAKNVAAIEAVFDDDFTNSAVTPGLANGLVWSPTNAQSALIGILNDAKTSLIVENEEMSDSDVIDALSGAAARGVHVEIVMTASKSWDTAFTSLKATGVDIVTYARDAPLYIHAKIILSDYGKTGASVFIGSENFSNASLTENRELGIIVSDPTVLTAVNTTLTSDFKGGTAY
jgi:phosphatidylserine/phosphatidylglycerophosphate/cardiolipin synthase-like enzyme